jgi:hypothetical protein
LLYSVGMYSIWLEWFGELVKSRLTHDLSYPSSVINENKKRGERLSKPITESVVHVTCILHVDSCLSSSKSFNTLASTLKPSYSGVENFYKLFYVSRITCNFLGVQTRFFPLCLRTNFLVGPHQR